VPKNSGGGRNFFTPMAHVGLGTAPSHHDGLSLLTTFSCSLWTTIPVITTDDKKYYHKGNNHHQIKKLVPKNSEGEGKKFCSVPYTVWECSFSTIFLVIVT